MLCDTMLISILVVSFLSELIVLNSLNMQSIPEVLLHNIHFTKLAALVRKIKCFKISVKVSSTFTSQLMSNYTTKMTQVPFEINGNLHFSQNWNGETY